MNRLRTWLAGGPRPPEDAVLVLAPSSTEMGYCAPLIEALSSDSLRVTAVLVAPDAGEAAQLSARFPSASTRVLSPLAPARASLTALRVRAVLALSPEALTGPSARLFRRAVAQDLPVYAAKIAGKEGRALDGTPLSPPHDPSDGPGLTLARVSTVGGELPPGLLEPVQAALLLARAAGVERGARSLFERLAAAHLRLGFNRITAGFIRRIDSIGALDARLGHPRTVLCLGNGPSSAMPAVTSYPHDSLFRVNIDWRTGGTLTEPDLVFAGVKRAMRRLGRIPMVVATPRKEEAFLACRLFEPWHGPATYSVAEALAPDLIPPVRGELRPTTGAYMLAVAVALAPERLVIAGMDMFRHPEGAYSRGADPVAQGSVNAFAPSHDFETDAAFIADCLAHYAGELIVFSPALAAALRERCGAGAFTLRDLSGAGPT